LGPSREKDFTERLRLLVVGATTRDAEALAGKLRARVGGEADVLARDTLPRARSAFREHTIDCLVLYLPAGDAEALEALEALLSSASEVPVVVVSDSSDRAIVLLRDRLNVAVGRSRRRPTSLALLFLDLDGFKGVNDSLGHDAGDDLLVEVARRLQRTLRPGDTVVRYGGDEFVILCEDLRGEREALRVAERARAAITEPFLVHGHELEVRASVGVARARPSGRAPSSKGSSGWVSGSGSTISAPAPRRSVRSRAFRSTWSSSTIR
jgi:diguanylate cyclase (GGDEF)-like protein